MSNSLLPRRTGRPIFASLVARAAGDQWLLLGSGVIGGLGWAVGTPALAAGAVAVVCLVVGAVTKVLVGDVDPPQRAALAGPARGTEAAHLMQALDEYLADLRALRESETPDVVTDATVEALVAARDARDNAAKAAAAVQALESALDRSQAVHARARIRARGDGVDQAEARMRARRDQLLASLDRAVAEIAEVYTKLLELTATASLDTSETLAGSVGEVSTSLDSLRAALGELEGSTRGDDVST